MTTSKAQVTLHVHELQTQVEELIKLVTEDMGGLASIELGVAALALGKARVKLEEGDTVPAPPPACDLPTLDTILNANKQAEEPAVSRLDWVVRVWKLDRQGKRARAHSSSHVFIDEDKGRDYFTRSVAAHQAKANRTDASFVVVLATQDPRDWKKADERGWTEHEETVIRKAGR